MSNESVPAVADYVIVGAGSAGCVLAEGLSRHPEHTVVLLEAGPPDNAGAIRIPAAFPRLFGTPYSWDYTTTPQRGLHGRRLYWPRGRTLGGSSSINAQIWTTGHRADYDAWQAGSPGWAYSDVASYLGTQPGHRPDDQADPIGIQVADLRDPSPSTLDFLSACAQAGHGVLADAAEPEGAGAVRVTQRDGRRWSSADAYLRPARQRPNLVVSTDTRARRVLVERRRAVGVEYQRPDGSVQVVSARREVILAAGAVGSPQLLIHSGIGDPARLRDARIKVTVPSPAVGTGLADHLFVPLVFLDVDGAAAATPTHGSPLSRFVASGRGPLTSNLAEALVFLRTEATVQVPDVELVWMSVPFIDHGRGADGPGVALGVVLLRPASTGAVTVDTDDPLAEPSIDPGYLTDPAATDMRTMCAGIRAAQKILATAPMEKWTTHPVDERCLSDDEQVLAEFVRADAETLYHPVGTCGMGQHGAAVVDPRLRVRGLDGLRVADASVMPSIPGAHTHAPTVMIARRAVEFIQVDAVQASSVACC